MELPVAGTRRCLNSVIGNYSIAARWCRVSGLPEHADSSHLSRSLQAVGPIRSKSHKVDVEFEYGVAQPFRCYSACS